MSIDNLSKFQIFLRKSISSLIPVAKYRRSVRRRWLHQRNGNNAQPNSSPSPFSHNPGPYHLEDVMLANLPVAKPRKAINGEDVTVVIPVYNGLRHLKALFASLFERTCDGVKFLIVDDCSPDAEVAPFLEFMTQGKADCRLVRNEGNLGFLKTINKAAGYVETPYFILLNTDTVVPQGWVERLMAPFASYDFIASTTPFSNKAVHFSYPKFTLDNELPEGFTLEDVDLAFSRITSPPVDRCYFSAGVGFCMGVNKLCWDQIGPFDADTFGRGYGEESDWCMRARSKGWENVLVPNLFVLHDHGGSFQSEEKKKLCEEHFLIIQKRWPGEMQLIDQFNVRDPWMVYRDLATLYLGMQGGGCVLLIDCSADGDEAWRRKLGNQMKDEGKHVLLLESNSRSGGQWLLTPLYIEGYRTIPVIKLESVGNLFPLLKIREIHVNKHEAAGGVFGFDYYLSNWKKTYLAD